MERVTRDMPQLMLRASFDVSTVNEKERTVELTWTTGAKVLRTPWFDDAYYEELSLDPQHVRMSRLTSGTAPMLNTHRSYDIGDILGVVDNARLDKTEGRATVRFDSGAEGEDAFRRVKERTLRNVSVGYRTYKLQKVEGGEGATPVYRAVDWEPYEISLCPMGADAGAVTRSAGGTNPCEFIQERAMPPVEPEKTETPIVVSPTPAVAPISAETRAEIARVERERIAGIERIGATLKRSTAEIKAAVDGAVSLEKFRADSVDALANAPADKGGPIAIDKRDARVQPGADERDKFIERAGNWLILRANLGEMVTNAAKKRGETVDLDPGDTRGMTLLRLAEECLERAGVRTRGMDVMQMIGLAFTHRGGGANSTSDFPLILENTTNKTLLSAYLTTPDTWRQWCIVGSVTDFRPHNRYRQGSFGVFDKLGEGGEYKQAAVPDAEKNQISADTKGRLISITRKAIINDDMGAFSDVATRLGRAAALTIEVDAYAMLGLNGGNGPTMGDGLPMFHANHGNIGAAAALSVASVDADRVLMAKQMDVTKNELLELRPAILLLAVGLGGQARVINGSQYDVDKIANARNQEPNKVVGLYKNIVDTARLTGTTRYSITAPEINPVFEVAFLNGVELPYLEMQQVWNIDGVQYKARLDYGTAGRDWRGIVMNAGA